MYVPRHPLHSRRPNCTEVYDLHLPPTRIYPSSELAVSRRLFLWYPTTTGGGTHVRHNIELSRRLWIIQKAISSHGSHSAIYNNNNNNIHVVYTRHVYNILCHASLAEVLENRNPLSDECAFVWMRSFRYAYSIDSSCYLLELSDRVKHHCRVNLIADII